MGTTRLAGGRSPKVIKTVLRQKFSRSRLNLGMRRLGPVRTIRPCRLKFPNRRPPFLMKRPAVLISPRLRLRKFLTRNLRPHRCPKQLRCPKRSRYAIRSQTPIRFLNLHRKSQVHAIPFRTRRKKRGRNLTKIVQRTSRKVLILRMKKKLPTLSLCHLFHNSVSCHLQVGRLDNQKNEVLQRLDKFHAVSL